MGLFPIGRRVKTVRHLASFKPGSDARRVRQPDSGRRRPLGVDLYLVCDIVGRLPRRRGILPIGSVAISRPAPGCYAGIDAAAVTRVS